MQITRSLLFVACTFVPLFFPASIGAETINSQTYTGSFPASITGSLPNQGTVLEQSFTVSATSNLLIYTNSYATGGFQPSLTLYNPGGTYRGSQAAIPFSGATPDPGTGATLDSFLQVNALAPGTYTLALTDWLLQQSVTATSLSDGFKFNLGNGVSFVDVRGATRTGQYAFAIQLTQAGSAVPEPTTFLLALPALGAVFLGRKRALRN